MAAGALVLRRPSSAWERLRQRRGPGQPLVDLACSARPGFTWGTTLSTMISFALFGVTFAMPQYFLDVRGLDSLGSGIRMLPLIGGLVVGLGVGQRLQSAAAPAGAGRPARRCSAPRSSAAAGFAIMAVALADRHRHGPASGTGFWSAWFALTGLGLGLAMPTMLNAALSALSPERSGSGSALMTRHAPGRRDDRGGRARYGAGHGLPQPAGTCRACRRSGQPRRAAAWLPASRSPRRALGRTLASACTSPRAYTSGWTSCSGSARASRSPPPCSPRCSCRGTRPAPPRRSSPARSGSEAGQQARPAGVAGPAAEAAAGE